MGQLLRAGEGHRSLDAAIARLAVRRHGVFSRADAMRLGATKSMIQARLATGRWERADAQVFRVGGTPATWQGTLMAACLAWGDDAVASHAAAAALHRLAGFPPGPVELTVPRGRKGPRDHPAVVHRSALDTREITAVGPIPATSPARTMLDLASTAPAGAVEESLDDALRRGLVSIGALRRAILRADRRPGVVLMRDLLAARDSSPVPESVFETRLLRTIKDAGLPAPVLQHPVREGGRLIARLDFAYPDHRLGIEADGFRWHSGRVDWARDRERANRLTLLGWRILRVTWADLTTRPGEVVAAIRAALDQEVPKAPRPE